MPELVRRKKDVLYRPQIIGTTERANIINNDNLSNLKHIMLYVFISPDSLPKFFTFLRSVRVIAFFNIFCKYSHDNS